MPKRKTCHDIRCKWRLLKSSFYVKVYFVNEYLHVNQLGNETNYSITWDIPAGVLSNFWPMLFKKQNKKKHQKNIIGEWWLTLYELKYNTWKFEILQYCLEWNKPTPDCLEPRSVIWGEIVEVWWPCHFQLDCRDAPESLDIYPEEFKETKAHMCIM